MGAGEGGSGYQLVTEELAKGKINLKVKISNVLLIAFLASVS